MTQTDTDKLLEIYVNRRKFQSVDGVEPEMTGGQIADLVGVPHDNAVIRLETEKDPVEVKLDEKVEIKSGMQFLVTRKTVDGGYGTRTRRA